jgi:sigma-E factor negative regulatory protein RseA
MEDLSALMDGELDASAAAVACGRWRDDSRSRADWHAYQLIGDVLRSEDLASTARRDRDFLAALRVKLAEEPVVLAPAATRKAAVTGGFLRRSWAAPAAVAAGFVAVAGVLVVTQMGGLTSGDAQSGARVAQVAPVPVTPAADPRTLPSSTDAVALNGQLIRDVRLDEYLAAHKKFGGSSAPGGPSGFLRNAAVESTGR